MAEIFRQCDLVNKQKKESTAERLGWKKVDYKPKIDEELKASGFETKMNARDLTAMVLNDNRGKFMVSANPPKVFKLRAPK